MKNFLLILLFSVFFSCNSTYEEEQETSNKPDTVILKFGSKHPKGTALPDHRIWLLNPVTKKPYTRFYEDSIYKVDIKYGIPVRLEIIPLTSNFEIDFQDSAAVVRTFKASDSWGESKMRFGFLVDTTQNIVFVHMRASDPEDSTQVIDTMTREDTLGFYEFQLHKQPKL